MNNEQLTMEEYRIQKTEYKRKLGVRSLDLKRIKFLNGKPWEKNF